MYEFVYTVYPEIRTALKDLREKIKNVDFEPNLGILFLTGRLINYYYEFSRILPCDTLCIPIEGFVTHEAVWSRGALVLLLDMKINIQKFGGPTDRVCKDLADSKKSDFSLLVYPAFYFGSRLSLLNALIREKRFYSRYKKGDYEALKRASEFLEEKLIYPINKILRPFRDRGEKAISINLFPLEIKFNTPLISLNGKELKRAIVRIKFKNKIKVDYSDTFPNRGKSFDETVEILKNEFGPMAVKTITVEKEGVAIGHINGFKVTEYVARQRKLSEIKQNIVKDLEQEKFFGASPYAIWFISEETYGSSDVGIFEYPLGIYPSLYDLDKFSDTALLSFTEASKSGLKEFYKSLENKDFDLAIIDQNYLLMYESRIIDITKYFKNKYGIFTLSSCTIPYKHKKFMTEIENNIFLNLTRNISYIKF